MLIPSTRVEDEKLGPMADDVKERAKQTGQEALEHGKQVAQDAAETARTRRRATERSSPTPRRSTPRRRLPARASRRPWPDPVAGPHTRPRRRIGPSHVHRTELGLPDRGDLGDWRGQDVIDTAGDKAGKLEDVFYDAHRDEPAFIAVKSGLIGKRLTLVPVAGASVTRDHVRVSHAKDQIKNAPSFDPDAELTPTTVDAYGYYGLSTPRRRGGGARQALIRLAL